MPLPSLSKLMGHAQVTTTQIYTAGADPKLAAAYQTAMAQLSQPAPALAPEPPAASAPQLAVLPLPLPPLPDLARRLTEAPIEIRAHCLAYYEHCRPTWNPRRRRHSADSLLYSLEGFWRWQSAQRPISQLSELTLADLRTYQQTELARGLANTTINRRLDDVLAVLRFAADRDTPVDASVFRYRPLPRPDSLPRHLTDSEYRRLEQHMLSRAQSTDPLVALENALFFVLAHTGIRASECIDLQYSDLDLAGRRLWVRLGKGQHDRLVYLSDTACQAISHYLAGYHRPAAAPLWTRPDGKAVDYNWLKCRLPALGAAIGVTPLTAQRLRHTLATRLLNAGMAITGIQKLLGHEYLVTTQIYARIADRTVEDDYYQAMRRIDLASMPLSDIPLPVAGWPIGKPAQAQLDNSV
jgi:site-specific recombinase XerD